MQTTIRSLIHGGVVVAFLVAASTASYAQTVAMGSSTETTTLTAVVSEQAAVAFPGNISFTVSDIATATASSAQSVSVSNIVLATASKQLRIALQAESASFTPPVAEATTWAAGDVSWAAGSWTNATGAAGTLSSSAYNTVATCDADAAACGTTGLVLTLASKPTVKRSGSHTLVVRWKVEATGS